ncbi:MAG TPA: PucR family transcriptional regulator [Solirubrobacteraceae bacterium]|jgi:DNA-binding PucR family transcriptional regulator|nr:PucR family transcriptional regulator [Solirubrobacteraceae bacterium]
MEARVAQRAVSPRVAELIRQGAGIVLALPEEVIAELDEVTLAAIAHNIADDPGLAAAIRRTNRGFLAQWAQANAHDPGSEVVPSVGPEMLAVARDLVRRGLDDTTLEAFRLGQNVVWRRWMGIAFTLTDDPQELAELLDQTAAQIFSFVDKTLSIISEQMQCERDELKRSTHAVRFETVSLIIGGAPLPRERAATMLGYELEQHHTAAIVWSDQTASDPSPLDRAAEALAEASGARCPFTVVASAATLWVWVPGSSGPDVSRLERLIADLPGVRVAIGPTATGIDGFRASHLAATATQRLMVRVASDVRVASYDAVEIVALVTADESRAAEFVSRTLGELESANPSLRETMRTYLRVRSNATRTAEVLFSHRNTVLARLSRAEDLLPRSLEENSLAVAVALEVVHWRGR